MGEPSDSGGNESNNEPQGTVFGVDGVSKTGSTSQDQQIGYTDGQGGKGANFDALQGATSQQTSAAVAAANAAKASGGSETAQQAAVRNVLESTESGQSAINQAAQDALESERVSRDQQAANIMGLLTSAPPVRTPANFDDTLNRFLDEDITSPDLIDPEAAALRSRVPDPTAPLTVAEESNLVKMFSERGLDPAAGQEEQRVRNERALNAARNLGITTLPEAATARAVLNLQSNQPPTGTARIIRQKGPGGDTSSQQLFETLDPATQALIEGTGTTAPASQVEDSGAGGPIGSANVRPSGELYGGYEDDPAYDADIFGVPRYAGGQTGLDGQMQGFSDARQMGDFVNTATEGNFLTDIMSFLPGLDPVEANRNNVRDMMEAGAQFNQESGKLELDTGRGTLRMSDSGIVTYSGMPNPDYTGPFGNLVNPPAQTGDDEAMTTDVAKSPQDPCPPGYRLVDGVCQPVDDVTTAPPGSGFQFFPSGGFPTSFQPVTQATQVGQVNPFVLRPNVPQGIQGLSPTGAALGRQV